MPVTINTLIQSPKSEVFRRVLIKRRDAVTGLYESSWTDITTDVKSFGKITKQIDAARRNKLTFGTMKIVVNNENGLYSPHTSESSRWYGFLNQQRTLFRIESGYFSRTKNDYGVWRNRQFQGDALWDVSEWDADDATWDSQSTVFIGILSGDIPLSDNNQVSFNIKPMTSIFEEFPARNLTGWTSTGMTASQFLTMVRDQTSGGSYIFRPFFGDTTTNFDISTTAQNYANLNTSTAQGVFDTNVWAITEKLCEAENFVSYIASDGTFKFVSRDLTSSVAFAFHGAGSFNSLYGHSIKSISNYGPKITKYYSRVEVKYINADTTTSYSVTQGSYSISPASNAWVLGQRTLKVENLFIPNTATADAIAGTIFTDVSSLKNEVEITTSFIPHLDILNKCTITYYPSEFLTESLWDSNDWAADTTTSSANDLIWNNAIGDAFVLSGLEFKFLSIEIDLDNFQSKFMAREA